MSWALLLPLGSWVRPGGLWGSTKDSQSKALGFLTCILQVEIRVMELRWDSWCAVPTTTSLNADYCKAPQLPSGSAPVFPAQHQRQQGVCRWCREQSTQILRNLFWRACSSKTGCQQAAINCHQNSWTDVGRVRNEHQTGMQQSLICKSTFCRIYLPFLKAKPAKWSVSESHFLTKIFLVNAAWM